MSAELCSIISQLSSVFSKTEDIQEKFQALESLCAIFITVFKLPNDQFAQQQKKEEWVKNTRNTLFTLLSTKLSTDHKGSALFLVNQMIEIFGDGWIIEKEKLVELLIQTCRIEICLFLGGYEEKNLEDNALVNINKQEDVHLLINCYNLVEKIIKALVSEDETIGSLPNQSFLIIKQAIDDIFSAIIKFLMAFQKANKCDVPFVFATFKLYAIWLAEDTDALNEQFYKLLPYLLRLTSAPLQKGERDFTAIQFLLPAFDMCIATDTELCGPAAQNLVSAGVHVALHEWLEKTISSMRTEDALEREELKKGVDVLLQLQLIENIELMSISPVITNFLNE